MLPKAIQEIFDVQVMSETIVADYLTARITDPQTATGEEKRVMFALFSLLTVSQQMRDSITKAAEERYSTVNASKLMH